MTLTIQDMIESILDGMNTPRLTETCDTVKCGDTAQPVKGAVTTFMATADVIEKAAALGANFIITHEPTFYNHLDSTAGMEADPVVLAKKALLEKNGMVLWRLHDHIHRQQPLDGIFAGLYQALGWEDFIDLHNHHLCNLPPTTVGEIVAHVKQALGVPMVRMIGDLSQPVSRVAFMLGASGGESHLHAIHAGAEVVLCGELQEWEACVYVQDANFFGRKLAIIPVGHQVSEEPGMRWLAEWLTPRFPSVPITHIPAGDPFTVC